jgi:acylaminoacyl-peptidase
MHEHYWQRSPLSRVGGVTTPTILLCGENDRRTPLAQSELYYTALKLRGVDAALVVFPDDNHAFENHPSHWLEFIERMDGWLRRHTPA